MIATFKVEQVDLTAVVKDVIATSKKHKIHRLITSTATVIFFLILSIAIKANIEAITTISAILFLGFYLGYEKAMVYQMKRMVKKNFKIPFDCQVTFSETGIYREFNEKTQNHKWNQIKLVREDDKRYLLHFSEVLVIVIKKYPYNLSDEETQEYNNLIRHYLNKEELEIINISKDMDETVKDEIGKGISQRK